MKIEIPKVMTTIECKKCGIKTVREYQRGDYVYKELDACPKCPDTKQIITAIYKEVKEKEKTYNVKLKLRSHHLLSAPCARLGNGFFAYFNEYWITHNRF